jgi:phosphoribosyl 1,2-cyclic phosphodiesterase
MSQGAVKVRFWGVRVSTPTVDRTTWRYGGNTPCVEIEAGDGSRFILDCGTGLRILGRRYADTFGEQPIDAFVFVTHYHWDHIQGLPFFYPLYSERNHFHFYSFRSEYLGPDSLKRVMQTQMALPYFPVDLSVLNAKREYTEIAGGDKLEIRDMKISAQWLNHPQGCLGFRFETPAGVVVYATDNEPGVPKLDKNLRDLAAGADIYIHDAQYTPEQLATNHKDWGHSSWQEGVNVAREAGARNLVLFHHDPDSSDRMLDAYLRNTRQQFANAWTASEGMVMTLDEKKMDVVMRDTRTGQRREGFFRATIVGYTEEGRAFEEETVIRDLSLHGALLYLDNLPRLQSELQVMMEAPVDELHPDGRIPLRGFVIRREHPPGEKNRHAVGIVFAEEVDPDRIGG